MASLFRPVTIAYRTPDGRKCSKDAPGAVKVRIPAKVWYGRYKGLDGRRHTTALCANKASAGQMLAKLVTDSKMGRLGLGNPFEQHSSRMLSEHLADFRRFLEGKGNTEKHARQTNSRVQTILDGCRFRFIAELSASAVVEWLAAEREGGRLGVQTSNYYLRDVKSFCRWLVKDGRADRNPLAYLSGMNANTDVRLERRTLPDDEFSALVAAAKKAKGSLTWQTKCRNKLVPKTIRVPAGADRAMLYTLAAFVGFRAQEMASLVPESFDLGGDPPTVTVQAAYSKRRRKDAQPMRPDLALAVRTWLKQKPAGKLLWPGNWWKYAARMVQADLESARAAWIEEAGEDSAERQRRKQSDTLAYRDEAGRVFDFHALRHQFISNLAAAGVHPKVAQTLARHSTISLTMDRYTHLGLVDQTAALDKLPSLPGANGRQPREEKAELQATGTDPVRTRFVQIMRPQLASAGSKSSPPEAGRATDDDLEPPKLQGVKSDCDQMKEDEREEAPPGFEPGMADLQSAALPLG